MSLPRSVLYRAPSDAHRHVDERCFRIDSKLQLGVSWHIRLFEYATFGAAAHRELPSLTI